MSGPDVEQDVLAVEPVDLLVFPQHRSEHVHRFEPVRCESSRPIGGPLLIEVDLALLAGDRRREEDDRRERAQELDEGACARPGQVLGDL